MSKPVDNQSSEDSGGRHSASAPGSVRERPIRLCVIVTVDITLLNLCRGRFEYLTERGFEITAVCAPTPHAKEIESRGVTLRTAPLHRAITPLQDLRAIWTLYRLLRRGRFDVVEVSTPKAALVGSIAARLAGVPFILHLLRGLVYEEQQGFRRRLLKWSQTVPCRLAHAVVSISKSMMVQAIRERVCAAEKIRVLGAGSSNGIDLARLVPPTPERRLAMRSRIGLPADGVVAGFVGRMTGDKGIGELVTAFERAAVTRPDVHLLLVGDYEARDRPPQAVMDVIRDHGRIHHVGWQTDTIPYMEAMDLLVLPTYREGFGTVLIEGAAMGLPVVSTDIVGCRDAVAAGETAITVPPRDAAELERALSRLLDDGSLRERLGAAGRRRAERCFAQEHVWSMQEEVLRSGLRGRGD